MFFECRAAGIAANVVFRRYPMTGNEQGQRVGLGCLADSSGQKGVAELSADVGVSDCISVRDGGYLLPYPLS